MYDGDQDLNFYYLNARPGDVVLNFLASPIAEGKQHMCFREDMGPDGQRRFTEAHTRLAFEIAAMQMPEGVVPYHG